MVDLVYHTVNFTDPQWGAVTFRGYYFVPAIDNVSDVLIVLNHGGGGAGARIMYQAGLLQFLQEAAADVSWLVPFGIGYHERNPDLSLPDPLPGWWIGSGLKVWKNDSQENPGHYWNEFDAFKYGTKGWNDVGFLGGLILTITQPGNPFGLNAEHVGMIGGSNGAGMTSAFYHETGTTFAKIYGVVAHSIPLSYRMKAPPAVAPIRYSQGTKDPRLFWNGGFGENNNRSRPVSNVLAKYLRYAGHTDANGKPRVPDVVYQYPDLDPTDGCTAVRKEWNPSGGGTAMVHFVMNRNQGHVFAGVQTNDNDLQDDVPGVPCMDYVELLETKDWMRAYFGL